MYISIKRHSWFFKSLWCLLYFGHVQTRTTGKCWHQKTPFCLKLSAHAQWRQKPPFCLKLSTHAQKSILSWSISMSRILGIGQSCQCIGLVPAREPWGALTCQRYMAKYIYKLEMVQRRYARFVFGDYRTTSSVSAMINQLQWPTLQERRAQAKATMMYRIVYNLYMALSPYVWTDRLIVNAQGQKQVIHINLLQYLLTPLLA